MSKGKTDEVVLNRSPLGIIDIKTLLDISSIVLKSSNKIHSFAII